MRMKLLSSALAAALALAACSDTAGTDLTEDATLPTSGAGPDVTTGTSPQTDDADTLAGLQAELEQMSEAISESEASQELETAWDMLSAELAAAVAEMREDGTIAEEEIESGLEDFDQRLDELEVEENVRAAWESLRAQFEQMVSAG